MVVMPTAPLATSKARAVLPERYLRADAVANIQATALLGLAFAQGRGDLLRPAMADRIHQPYRSEICPLLPLLLPLAGREGILGAALSGAGPSVLLVLAGDEWVARARKAVQDAISGHAEAEILAVRFERRGVTRNLNSINELEPVER
jgi:homoserine kinase